MADVWANSMARHPRATCHTAGCCHMANLISWFQSYVPHRHLVNSFTVTIPEPHATVQGIVTWQNQCHDRATLQGVRIPSGILKIVFAIFYFFLFLMQFRLWRAAAFVSSPIHLLHLVHHVFRFLMAVISIYPDHPPVSPCRRHLLPQNPKCHILREMQVPAQSSVRQLKELLRVYWSRLVGHYAD